MFSSNLKILSINSDNPHLKKKEDIECDGFQCDDGQCIDIGKRCDRVPDCSNGEDEEFCQEGRFLAVDLLL